VDFASAADSAESNLVMRSEVRTHAWWSEESNEDF